MDGDTDLGKGGGGGGLPGAIPAGGGRGGGPHHGGGHRHGGFHHHRGGSPHWRSGPWFSPFVYEVPVPSYGIDIDQLLAASEAEDLKKEDTKALAKEIVKQLKLKGGKATVGEDLDLLDAEMIGEVGFISDIFQTAGNLAQTGVNIWQQEEQKKQAASAKGKAAEEEQRKASAAIVADAAATQAAARAAWTTGQKLPSGAADASAAAQTAAAQARAGAGLSSESTDKRLDAANKAWAAATAAARKNPKDPYSQALMAAWQQTVNKIQNVQITGPVAEGGGASAGKGGAKGGDKAGGDGDGLSRWLSGKTGPVPNKVIAGGGALVAAALMIKALR